MKLVMSSPARCLGFPNTSGSGVCCDFRNGFSIGVIPLVLSPCMGMKGASY